MITVQESDGEQTDRGREKSDEERDGRTEEVGSLEVSSRKIQRFVQKGRHLKSLLFFTCVILVTYLLNPTCNKIIFIQI